MILFIATALTILIAVYFAQKDRSYMDKEVKDVVSDDMKKVLNIKTESDEFPQKLVTRPAKKRASQVLLEALNDKQDLSDNETEPGIKV